MLSLFFMKFSVPFWGCRGIPPVKFCDFTRLRGRRSVSRPRPQRFDPPLPPHSVAVLWSNVLGQCLSIMAWLAQRLPVRSIPEEVLISTMGNDVVNHSGLRVSPGLLTRSAQRMAFQVQLALLLPAATVATLGCGTCNLRVQRLVFLAVHRTVRDEPCTAGVFARCVRTMRHSHSSQGRPTLPKCP